MGHTRASPVPPLNTSLSCSGLMCGCTLCCMLQTQLVHSGFWSFCRSISWHLWLAVKACCLSAALCVHLLRTLRSIGACWAFLRSAAHVSTLPTGHICSFTPSHDEVKSSVYARTTKSHPCMRGCPCLESRDCAHAAPHHEFLQVLPVLWVH